MNPITGPFLRQILRENDTVPSITRVMIESQWYRQRRPYNLPLYFYTLRCDNDVWLGSGDASALGDASASFQAKFRPYLVTDRVSGDPNVPWFTRRVNSTLGKALTRFNDKRGEAAELGVTLVQQKQAIDMIASRLQQGWRIIKALRKGRLSEAANELGIKKRTLRNASRKLSGLQLEVSFGWMPMISDVQTAVEVLNGPFPYGLARGTARLRETLTVKLASRGKATHSVVFTCYVAAHLVVDNPGMDVAQRLGLTDPLPVLYEVIPWSFVANWIFNLDVFINQYNGYHGVKVINPHYGVKIVDEYNMFEPDWTGDPKFALFGKGHGESFERAVGSLPTINLSLRPSVSMPWQRALNAISLLVQKGIKGR